jgi:hypothetical protein
MKFKVKISLPVRLAYKSAATAREEQQNGTCLPQEPNEREQTLHQNVTA